MADARRNEILQLQAEIRQEIEGDAPEIAAMVFGGVKDQPDLVGVPNSRLDDLYRQAYLKNDREFLIREAHRDPLQFEKVTDRLGVVIPPKPPTQAPVPVPPPSAPPVPLALPPPQPVLPTVPPPSAPLPMILGPNGQPLPPSGAF